MGSRALTRIVPPWDGKPFTTIYTHDGAEGLPLWLSGRLGHYLITNGEGPMFDPLRMCNGMGRFASLLVSTMRGENWNPSIYRPEATECGEERVCVLYLSGVPQPFGWEPIRMKLLEGPATMFGFGGGEDCADVAFDGLLGDYDGR